MRGSCPMLVVTSGEAGSGGTEVPMDDLRTEWKEPRNSARLFRKATSQAMFNQALRRRMDHAPSNPAATRAIVDGSGTAVAGSVPSES